MPVAAQVGGVERNDHDVADPDGNVLVAAGAEVRLRGLVRMDPPDLDCVLPSVAGQRGIRAHNSRRATTRNAAAT